MRSHNNSLDQLNNALDALERQIGTIGRGPRTAENDLRAIQDRQSALSRQAPLHQPAADRARALSAELAQMRADLEHERAAASRFENIRNGMNSLRGQADLSNSAPSFQRGPASPSPEFRAIQTEIEQIKQDVTLLAREDSLRDLADRWTVLEREIANLPNQVGTRSDLLTIADRVDHVQASLVDLPRHLPVAAMEEQLRALATAMEKIAASNGALSSAQIESVDRRLDEISHAIAAVSIGVSQNNLDPAPFERIEARIANLAHQIDSQAASQPIVKYDQQFNAITERLDALQTAAQTAIPAETMNTLATRLEDVANAVRSQHHSASGVDADTIDDMSARIVDISKRLEAYHQASSQTVDAITRSFDERMEELTSKIESNQGFSAQVPDLDGLERRLEDIADMMASGSVPSELSAPAPVDLAPLEEQIMRLSENLSVNATSSDGVVAERLAAIESHLQRDEDHVMAAALEAADKAVEKIGFGPIPNTSNEIANALTDRLAELDSLARDTNTRNGQTFEAIHDTLLKIVNHLSSLEEAVGTGGLTTAMTPSATPPPPAADQSSYLAPDVGAGDRIRARIDAPALDDAGHGLHGGDQGRAQTMPPAQAAAAAARAALTSEPSTEHTATSPSAEPTIPPAAADELDTVEPVKAAEEFGDDRILEPGSESPDLASIIKRVRDERGGPVATESNDKSAEAGKLDFIAAARRAAQAAAADVSIAKEEAEKENSASRAATLRAIINKKRKPILMGATAVLIALMSIPLIGGIMGSNTNDQAATEAQSTVIVEPSDDADAGSATDLANLMEPDTGDEADVNDDPAVRIIGDGEAVAATDPAAEPEESVASIPAEAAPDAPLAQTAAFQPIPESIGPIALREAAQSDDPAALYVIGDILMTENKPVDAAAWYKRSAEFGFAPAQYRIGNMLEKATGVEKDVDQALMFYQLAAQQGNVSAMHNLGAMLAGNAPDKVDMDSALDWFQKAADLGVKDSQFNLGILYGLGQGVERDLVKSYTWFALAAKDGDKVAADRRDEVAAQMSNSELEQARGAVALWKAGEIDRAVNVVEVPEAWRISNQITAAAPPPEDMKKAISNIQAILNNAGYDAGTVDGIMGEKTRQAITAFQKANGLPATGNIDKALVDKLLEVNDAGTS